MIAWESFVAGYAYGATTVIVAQPLDTIKTRMQAMTGAGSMTNVASSLYSKEGLKGFYRGGVSLIIGGGLMRAAQFGVYASAMKAIGQFQGGPTKKEDRWGPGGLLDPQVVAAGFAGGLGRGLVEGPFEYVKVKRQVAATWVLQDIFKGSGATMLRNSFLFCSFAIYMDVQKHLLGGGGLSPFWTGALCANLAWATVWPLDVVKTQLQSGNYQGNFIMLRVRYEILSIH
jgi:solute carrier family 25 carnitine/acylcarnitine transporter 20/29